LLRSLRFPLLEIGSADNFDDIRRTTRQVAAAVGQHARGEALIAHMDATLRELAHDAGPSLRIAAWDGAGFSARPGSLYDSILRAAGGRNVAGEGGAIASGSPDIEALLATAPSLLVRGAPGLDPPGRRDDVAYHPLINRIWRGKMVFVPLSAYACGTPFSADAALRLRDQMRRAATR
jgi:iron complex transport system substrate-binding protein